ncbi:2-hydroxychromene-2-carboxylate isomerase [Parahaliea aestuarii]|uniref:2-hydroxychromene-2-carboxylate isomerase n=1 Tax=Parahaliea aestuarii TaxID=1852021 RepID=A0A5C9A350_9GAMM|nr:2-hydroxychromene-2-carboxylate isomerase [Parahaliea aestuarii]TXS94372.1 2-hydroxychromene-2-carboxylate isomerase [Parahaliea aestuarii]
MSQTLEFLFDFGSPNAYLAHRVIPAIEQRCGVRFEYVPVLLGGVFKLTGNASPMQTMAGIRNKFEYEMLEMQRFIERHDLQDDYRMNPHFPVNTLLLMRGAVAARALGSELYRRYVEAMFTAMWRDGKKMDEHETIAEVLASSGLPLDTLLDAVQTQAVKDQLLANTEQAVERGVFGLPAFFVGEALYFGKDRLREVEEALPA